MIARWLRGSPALFGLTLLIGSCRSAPGDPRAAPRGDAGPESPHPSRTLEAGTAELRVPVAEDYEQRARELISLENMNQHIEALEREIGPAGD